MPSLPQEQGLKANSSKELSTCFTEVSGQSAVVQGPGHGRLFPGEPQTQGPRILLWAGPAELLARLGLLGTQTRGSGWRLGAEAAARALAVLGETL